MFNINSNNNNNNKLEVGHTVKQKLRKYMGKINKFKFLFKFFPIFIKINKFNLFK